MTALIPASSALNRVEIEQVLRAIAAGRSVNTQRAYASRWSCWADWCEERGRVALPAEPAEVAAHLAWLADRGLSSSTINTSAAAIRARHLDTGFDDPTATVGVQRTRVGLARTRGVAAARQAHPLTLLELRRMLASCDDDGVRGMRDRALLLVGYAGALRRSEIAALRVNDVAPIRDGVVLTLRRSKGDQMGRGEHVAIPRGDHRDTDPIAALHSWTQKAGIEAGPIFIAISKHNTVPRTARALSGAAIDAIIQARASAADLADLKITGHSLRAGHATAAAEAGIDASRIARTTRHRRLETLQRYVRPAEALRDTTARELGL